MPQDVTRFHDFMFRYSWETTTVRAKWRELGDPGKRGDDIHDVNGTGPVAAEHAEHQHVRQSATAATSVTLRNSEVQGA